MYNCFNNTYNDNNKSQAYSPEDLGKTIKTYAVNDFDTLQKARRDLIGEIQAVIEYDEHYHTSNNNLSKETWTDIKNEELVHIGELLGLLNYLDPNQKQYIEKGLRELEERMKK